MEVIRLLDGPIVSPQTHHSIGHNIQGPSLIKVPDWAAALLGRYYLYFADHKGSYIRLAYADEITGPWHIHPPGCLHLSESRFLTEPPDVSDDELATIEQHLDAMGTSLPHDINTEITTAHIASPDVHVDHRNKRIIMYFHGLDGLATQLTRVARWHQFRCEKRASRPPISESFRLRRHSLWHRDARPGIPLVGRGRGL